METKRCNLCKANFSSRFELKHHMLRIHNETKYLHEYFVCTICDVAFDRIESLQNHLENYAHHQRNKIFEPKKKNENNFKVSQTPNFVAEDRPKSGKVCMPSLTLVPTPIYCSNFHEIVEDSLT